TCDRRADLGSDRAAEIDAPPDERDLGAVRRQQAREVETEAAERACDEGGLAGEIVAIHGATMPAFRRARSRPARDRSAAPGRAARRRPRRASGAPPATARAGGSPCGSPRCAGMRSR